MGWLRSVRCRGTSLMKLNESLEYNGFLIQRHDTFDFVVYYLSNPSLQSYIGSFDDLKTAKITVDIVINSLWALCRD